MVELKPFPTDWLENFIWVTVNLIISKIFVISIKRAKYAVWIGYGTKVILKPYFFSKKKKTKQLMEIYINRCYFTIFEIIYSKNSPNMWCQKELTLSFRSPTFTHPNFLFGKASGKAKNTQAILELHWRAQSKDSRRLRLYFRL